MELLPDIRERSAYYKSNASYTISSYNDVNVTLTRHQDKPRCRLEKFDNKLGEYIYVPINDVNLIRTICVRGNANWSLHLFRQL